MKRVWTLVLTTAAWAADPLQLSLKRAVEIATSPEGSAKIQLADEAVKVAGNRQAQARAALLPNVDGTFTAQNLTRNLEALGVSFQSPIPGFQFPTFVGPFTLPRKEGDGWITIRTSAPETRLPPPDVRVDPSHAGVMPKLEASSRAVIVTAPGAHHYRFVGIEIRPKARASLVNLVELGAGEPTAELVPSHLIFDRCYLHGDAEKGTRRGIAMNSRHTAVVNSYLSDFKDAGVDSQAIGGWAGAGPF